jgi:hypothetical protein
MIDVGVGKNDIGQNFRIKMQESIFCVRVLAPALVKTAIQQDVVGFGVDHVHGSGNFSCGTIKGYVHVRAPF